MELSERHTHRRCPQPQTVSLGRKKSIAKLRIGRSSQMVDDPDRLCGAYRTYPLSARLVWKSHRLTWR